jgi:hypothetical protein
MKRSIAALKSWSTVMPWLARAERFAHRLVLERHLASQAIVSPSKAAVTNELTVATSTWPNDSRKGPIVVLSVRLDCRAKGGWSRTLEPICSKTRCHEANSCLYPDFSDTDFGLIFGC